MPLYVPIKRELVVYKGRRSFLIILNKLYALEEIFDEDKFLIFQSVFRFDKDHAGIIY